MKITKAIETDAKSLTELSIRSKWCWNYEKEQIEGWKEDAENFYSKLGFRVIGKLESSIKNRFLSIMAIETAVVNKIKYS
ncbi:hypothetical protein [Pricia antarctica]|uniref:hypothetical protein n=1 Tax=Pricia antarctica TaxID=641691 RepID=UPI0011144B63|nr:hypothetical protein [Pricia antarctica]